MTPPTVVATTLFGFLWLSTVAEPLPLPVLVAAKVDVPVPEVSVELVGLTVPSVPPKVTGVPSGTLKPEALLLFLVMLAVSVLTIVYLVYALLRPEKF